MNENNARVVHAALLAALSTLAFPVHASDPEQPQAVQVSQVTALRNDLEGAVQGQVDFAQTHVVAATRRIFDPLLVPERGSIGYLYPHWKCHCREPCYHGRWRGKNSCHGKTPKLSSYGKV